MKRLVFLVLVLASGYCQAACYAEAAHRYGIPEELLRAIAKVESSYNPEATNLTHYQRTKSYDIGLMQINSSWLPRLASMGITEQMLREPCQNVLVGAWILSHHFREAGADWNGVGSYNASCKTLTRDQCANVRYGYAWKVYRALMRSRNLPPDGDQTSVQNRIQVTKASQRFAAGRAIRTVEITEPPPEQEPARQVLSLAAPKPESDTETGDEDSFN